MSRPVRARLGAFLTVLLGSAFIVVGAPAVVAPAGAQISPSISVFPMNGAFVQVGSMSFDASLNEECDTAPTAANIVITAGTTPVTPTNITVVDTSNFTFTMTATPSLDGVRLTPFTITVTCPVSTVSTEFTNGFGYLETIVTKTVTGPGPAGQTYTINATCTPNPMFQNSVSSFMPARMITDTVTVAIPVTADSTSPGTNTVFMGLPFDCTYSEPNTIGYTATITPATPTFELPSLVNRVDVVNAFPETVVTPKYTG